MMAIKNELVQTSLRKKDHVSRSPPPLLLRKDLVWSAKSRLFPQASRPREKENLEEEDFDLEEAEEDFRG